MRVAVVGSAGALAAALCLMTAGGAAVAAPPAAPLGPDEGWLAGGTTITLPLPASPVTGFSAVGAGNHASLGLANDGEIFGWGAGAGGVLGTGDSDTATTPVHTDATAGINFEQLAVGTFTAYAVDDAGLGYSWGEGRIGLLNRGLLGAGAQVSQRMVPGPIEMPPNATFSEIIAAEERAFALATDGTAYAWGSGQLGQLGDGNYTSAQLTPTPVTMPQANVTFTRLSALGDHAVAIGSDGNTYAWGSNSDGLLGKAGQPTMRAVPTKVFTPNNVTYTDVAVGWDFSIAIGNDQRLYAWGSNYLGALGNPSTGWGSAVPVRVQTPQQLRFVKVVSGGKHTLALTDEGEIYAWGANHFGAIGNGTSSTTGQDTPVPVTAPLDVRFTDIAAGAGTSFAIGDDGKTYSWGQNGYYQLGDGTAVESWEPTPVLLPLVDVTAVSFGGAAGTDIQVDRAAGTFSVVAPAGTAYGPVDVTVDWTVGGWEQSEVVLADAFSYVDAPIVVTQPGDVAAQLGETAVFSTAVTGFPAPTVTWQFSRDGGTTWLPVTADPGVTVAPDGASIRVAVAADHQGMQFRALASNRFGEAETAHAALQIPTHTVTFDAADGSAPVTQTVLAGGVATALTPAPERVGHAFTGWHTSSGATYDFATPVVADTVLTAGWELLSYRVSFDTGGGSAIQPVQVDHGALLQLPAAPTRKGFDFVGWFTDAAATEKFVADRPITGELTLYAAWKPVAAKPGEGGHTGSNAGGLSHTGAATDAALFAAGGAVLLLLAGSAVMLRAVRRSRS